MKGLEDIQQQASKLSNNLSSKPPLHLWHPPLSGTIDIVIKSNGDWLHEGDKIERQPLVNLFASILRREEDGEYYLVTPNEKWRLSVEDFPLLIVQMDIVGEATDAQCIMFTTNVETQIRLDNDHCLVIDTDAKGQPIPHINIGNGLSAKLNRAVFYRLVSLAQEINHTWTVQSAGKGFELGAV